jgi:hypothetical protein
MILNLQNKSGTLESFIDLECFSLSGALTYAACIHYPQYPTLPGTMIRKASRVTRHLI